MQNGMSRPMGCRAESLKAQQTRQTLQVLDICLLCVQAEKYLHRLFLRLEAPALRGYIPIRDPNCDV